MDEPTAWLYQAMADRQSAGRFVADEVGTGRCHAIAKWQQTVEKAVKALVSALHDAGILGAGVLPRHAVERYVRSFGCLVPQATERFSRTYTASSTRTLGRESGLLTAWPRSYLPGAIRTSPISTVCEGSEPLEHARKRLMQAAYYYSVKLRKSFSDNGSWIASRYRFLAIACVKRDASPYRAEYCNFDSMHVTPIPAEA